MENTIIWAVECTTSYDWEDSQSYIVKVFSTKEKAADYIKLAQKEVEKHKQKYIHYLESESENEYIEPPHDEYYSIIELIIE
jgi:hypothetical protein